MNILVSDTSVLFDLEKGGLLEATFSCGLTLIVPDFLYQKELKNRNGQHLLTLGLGVAKFSPEESLVVQEVFNAQKGLSLPDCSALVCAARNNHVLLTGDRLLRKEAEARKISVCGIFWILDHLESSGISTSLLYEALELIAGLTTCRLPKDEIKIRLQKWSS